MDRVYKYTIICTLSIVPGLISLPTGCIKEDDDLKTRPETVTDIDGNTYNTVRIGDQIWMAENLRTTRFNDGAGIPLITSNSEWGNTLTPGYCWFYNDPGKFRDSYGALYNWYAVNTDRLCPEGWHVPSDIEWTRLTDYLGGEALASRKLEAIATQFWENTNNLATNETGFSALPGGYRFDDGHFYLLECFGFWWTSTEDSEHKAWRRGINFTTSHVIRIANNKERGFSIRCIKY